MAALCDYDDVDRNILDKYSLLSERETTGVTDVVYEFDSRDSYRHMQSI